MNKPKLDKSKAIIAPLTTTRKKRTPKGSSLVLVLEIPAYTAEAFETLVESGAISSNTDNGALTDFVTSYFTAGLLKVKLAVRQKTSHPDIVIASVDNQIEYYVP